MSGVGEKKRLAHRNFRPPSQSCCGCRGRSRHITKTNQAERQQYTILERCRLREHQQRGPVRPPLLTAGADRHRAVPAAPPTHPPAHPPRNGKRGRQKKAQSPAKTWRAWSTKGRNAQPAIILSKKGFVWSRLAGSGVRPSNAGGLATPRGTLLGTPDDRKIEEALGESVAAPSRVPPLYIGPSPFNFLTGGPGDSNESK